MKTPAELAYEGALRAIDVHERMLESLRNRTGSVIAAGSISASFLGATALDQQNPSGWAIALGWGGILAFVGSLGAAVAVLWPRTKHWPLEVSPRAILKYATAPETISAPELKRMAIDTEKALEGMAEKMKPYWNLFRVSVILLGAQVALWLTALGIESR